MRLPAQGQPRGSRAQVLPRRGGAYTIPVTHAAEFFALLGGGLRDAGWDGSARCDARLAILAGLTHYDIFQSHQLAAVVKEHLR